MVEFLSNETASMDKDIKKTKICFTRNINEPKIRAKIVVVILFLTISLFSII